MALFRIQYFFSHPLGKWTNVYHVNATTFLDAATVAVDSGVTDAIRSLEHPDTTLVQVRTSDLDPDTDVFQTVPLGLAGTSTDAGSILPLFNRARVDVAVSGGGRPSRKYIAGFITEGLQEDGILLSTAVTYVENAFGALIAAVITAGGELADPDGQNWLVGTCLAPVAMHQLHRKRKKKATP